MKQISRLPLCVSLLIGIQIFSKWMLMWLLLMHIVGRNTLFATVLILIDKLYFLLRCYAVNQTELM